MGRPHEAGDDDLWIEKKRGTIPLSKHRRIRTNVLFQKNATNFAHRGRGYGKVENE
jgi:hypothetical protein